MSNLKAALKEFLMTNMDGKLDSKSNFHVVGLRGDDRAVKVGDILDNSKVTWDQEDGDVPAHGTAAYDALEYADGVCTHKVCDAMELSCADTEEEINEIIEGIDFDCYAKGYKHASIILGEYSSDETQDEGEVIIKDPEIAKVLY